MRALRNLVFAAVALTAAHGFVSPAQLVAQSGYYTCSCSAGGCFGGYNFCGEACAPARNCADVCGNSGCGNSTGGTPNNVCYGGQCGLPSFPAFNVESCSCCLPDWWGCGSNAQCCGSYCNPETYLCGDDCYLSGWGCSDDNQCCSGWCGRDTWVCSGSSPILINVANNGNDHLTSAADGVLFDIDADGTPERTAWTSPQSPVGFLVLDRNGNGAIDNGSELFGNATQLLDGSRAGNGFEALKELDSNHDNRVDSRDQAWSALRIWFDSNHNGYSEPDELFALQQVGVKAILTQYRETRRRDQFGNRYKYEGIALLHSNGDDVARRIFDVFFDTIR